MLSNVLPVIRLYAMSSCSRISFDALLKVRAGKSILYTTDVPLNGWYCMNSRRLLQTSSSSDEVSSAIEAYTESSRSCSSTQKTVVHLEELTQRLDSRNIKLIDVREPWEILETGSIATSINIPLAQLKSALTMSEEEFMNSFDIPKPRQDDTRIVFYGLSSVMSAAAVKLAHQLGFKGAQHYVGGWQEWSLMCRS